MVRTIVRIVSAGALFASGCGVDPRKVALLALVAAAACESGHLSAADVAGDLAVIEVGPRADAAQLASRIKALVGSFEGGAAIWIADVGDPRPLYARDADKEVVAASLYKLGVMLHVEDLVERHELTYADTITIEPEDVTEDGSLLFPGAVTTIDDALELMIARSDNGTALALWRTYGARSINATLDRYRLGGLRIGERDEDSVVNARAVGELLERVARRELVSTPASDRMLARLERQTVGGRAEALLPEGTRVAHKTGDLPGLAHDAAVVFTPTGARVVVVLTWDATEDAAHELIARVAQAAYETAR